MGEDQPRVGELTGELDGMQAERRDAASGVDQHRQPALVGQRDDVPHARVVERELLGPRMELDPARPARERALGLGDRVGLRVQAAERDQPALGGEGLVDHRVVGRRIAVGLVHREDEGAPGVGDVEQGDQLGERLAHAVGVVFAEVRVGIPHRSPGTSRSTISVQGGVALDRSTGHSYHERDHGTVPHRPLDARRRPIPNRVVLAPLAGIGNWFVRLQAKRYGAGLAVSEMVSSFAVHYGNERTCTELLRIHPDERVACRCPSSCSATTRT